MTVELFNPSKNNIKIETYNDINAIEIKTIDNKQRENMIFILKSDIRGLSITPIDTEDENKECIESILITLHMGEDSINFIYFTAGAAKEDINFLYNFYKTLRKIVVDYNKETPMIEGFNPAEFPLT